METPNEQLFGNKFRLSKKHQMKPTDEEEALTIFKKTYCFYFLD